MTRWRYAMGVLGAVLTVGCAHRDDEPAGDAVATVAVTVDTVRAEAFSGAIDALGSVVVRPGHIASLGAPGAARVQAVRVAAGDEVRAGTVLIELDPAPFEGAVQAAEAALLSATRAHDRAQRLVDAGIAPRKDLDLATSDLAQATTAASLARRQRGLAVIRSPIDGVVLRVGATLGASVDGTAALVDVADPTFSQVVLSVSADEAARIATGALVTLRAGAGATADSLGTGVVERIAGVIDSASRTVAVRVRTTAVTRALRVGESVSGSIALATHPAALLVPQAAIVPDGDSFRVFTIDSASIAHARTVELGARRAGRVEVVRGLRPAERIVSDGAYQVDEGTHIVVKRP